MKYYRRYFIDINDKYKSDTIIDIVEFTAFIGDNNTRSSDNEYQSAVPKINFNRSNDYTSS